MIFWIWFLQKYIYGFFRQDRIRCFLTFISTPNFLAIFAVLGLGFFFRKIYFLRIDVKFLNDQGRSYILHRYQSFHIILDFSVDFGLFTIVAIFCIEFSFVNFTIKVNKSSHNWRLLTIMISFKCGWISLASSYK